jgi:two-component system cell cycle sensor histidine kinase/response regulator CckA
MIQSLLRFGSPAASRVATVSARDFMEKTIKFLSSIVDKRVEVTLAPGQETEKVEIDENQLLQVFTNLVINAQHAMPKGGAITISIQPRDIVWGPGTSYSGVKPGRYMEIAIQDTGTGIARENLQRVFEPFFTTKEPGVGTGLGLSVAYSIVQNHRGWIEVTSPPGSGARFIVVLPAV